ncbi:hypothetical protein JCM33374_g5643 [Metschnikowia sp. JCM 33374]|nr:hypothetical protein JCM33374_g5643 [Metschnikowia sp. JCM 33374]
MADESKQLKDIAGLVSHHLSFNDEDLTLSRFMLKLYNESMEKPPAACSSQFSAFKDTVMANGGDEFPPNFIKEVHEKLSVASGPPQGTPNINSRETSTSTSPSQSLSTSSDRPSNSQIGSSRVHTPTLDRPSQDHIEQGRIYRGYVSNITPYGAFIRLNSPTSFLSGLCHVSRMSFDGKTRIRHPQDVVRLNQELFIRVDEILKSDRNSRRDKISLSMVGVDQLTGIDKSEELVQESTQDKRGRASFNERNNAPPQKRRRLTSPERWEIRQLIASGAASASDYPELNAFHDEDMGDFGHEVEESVDIELNTDEPKFLKGQMTGGAFFNPMSILKNPEGSLSRSAMTGSKLVQEVREEKSARQKQLRKDAITAQSSSDPIKSMSERDLESKEKTEEVINQWRQKQRSQKAKLDGSTAPKTIAQQRKSLPVYSMRSELVEAIKENQFLVIVGETGSGKTTQIVQYAYEEALNVVNNESKIIGCTQPRRVAAVSVAARVADEVGCKVGDQVGYTIRFEDKTSSKTMIKYMTDGMLQREALLDPTMSKYALIMLDEAHERTIATDVLFALLKTAAQKNPNLKVLVTSATLDSDKFSKYFDNCPILKIPGRTYPVEVLFSREPEQDYLAAALDCVMQIHVAEAEGDILVFLTGQEEIETSVEVLNSRVKTLGSAVSELVVVPVYAALPSEMQSKIFEPAPDGARKVVLATNIAETSITIDGIKYVVDPGFVKVNAYDPKLGMDSLIVSPISRAQANQRSGRAGRTGPGKCFRLYTEKAFELEMLPNSIPEIQRKNLASTILMLKAMGINDLLNFQFMDPPPTQTMVNALHELYTLDALDDDGFLTRLGRQMADFPMEPALAKTLLASVDHLCALEVLTIVAMLSVQTVFYRPKEKQAAADQRKQRFHSIHGDHLTFLNVYKAWELSGRSSRWCKENYIHERSMRRAQDVKKQLESIMRKYGLTVESNDDNSTIRKAFCSGFFKNSAKRDPHEGIYNTLLDQTPVHIHPSSSIFGKSAEYVIYHTLLLTTKEYMHCATTIDPKWLTDLAPKFFKKSDPNNISERKRKEKIVPLFDRYAQSQDSWRLTAHVEAKQKALGQLHHKVVSSTFLSSPPMDSISQALTSARLAKDALSEKFNLHKVVPGIPGNGVKSLKKTHGTREQIASVENSGTSILPCQPLHIEDGDIVDIQGRRRVLKGINVDSAMKLPVTPFMPSYEGESSDASNIFFDGDQVSFVGRPFPLDTAESHLERIKSLGYNTIRYLVTWEALEHAGPGIYDEDFIDYTIKILRIIYQVGGLYVFLEPHQDVWSRYCGGSGAPLWTLYAAGLQPKRFSACEAAILHNSDKFDYKTRNDAQTYPKMLWTSNYKRLASLTMFTLFFSGSTYFPHLKINGMNIQNFLQSHHLNSLSHLWKAVVERLPEMFENGSMLGFESLNEPNSGLIGSPDLSTIPSSQHLRIGTTPTVYDCFRLGMGFPVEVDNFKIAITGPQKEGRVVVDPKGLCAWLSPEEAVTIDDKYGWKRSGWNLGKCIFASSLIWTWKDTDLDELNSSSQQSRLKFSAEGCELLKPNFFNEVNSDITLDVSHEKLPGVIDQAFFTNHFFVSYYVNFKNMVRSIAPDVFVLIQPPVLEEPPKLKDDARKIIDDKTIYCPHYYDGMSLMFKSWNYRYNVDTLGIMRGRYLNPVLGIVIGERAIRNCLKRQFIEIREEGRKFLGPIPVLMSETGMPFDMDDKRAYEDGRYQLQTSALDALANALEGSGMHHTYWCYTSINCHKWGDRWNNEDFSFWSPDDRDLAFDYPEEERSLNLSYRSDSFSSTRRSSVTPSIKSIRDMKDHSGVAEVLKTKLAYHRKRLVPKIFKKSPMNDLHDEYVDSKSSSVEESSLISCSTNNIRYRHFKQCYPSPDGIRAVSAVMRPFLVATLGSVKQSEFDIKSSKFVLTVTLDGKINKAQLRANPTIIFTPKWHYPYLNYDDISLNSGFVKYDEVNEYLEWYHCSLDNDGGCESSSRITQTPIEHTIIIKNHSGTLEELGPSDNSSSSECPIV